MFEESNGAFANYIEEDTAGKQQFLWVSLFFYLMKQAREECGVKGDGVMRQAVRNFGTERAIRMRQRANAQGLEPNLISLEKVQDLLNEPRFSFGKQVNISEEETADYKFYTCPNSNIWARLEGKKPGDYCEIGSVYCEEVHHYLYGKFDPAIQVNLTEILAKGDNLCNFHLNMRKANMKPYPLPDYQAETWEDYGADITASISTVFCLHYYHYAYAIYEYLGEEVLRRGLHEFNLVRGYRIREMNRRNRRKNTIETLLENGDLFLDPRIDRTIEKINDGQYKITVKRSILNEVMKSHQASYLTRIFYEEEYKGICEAYNPRIRTDLCHADYIDGDMTVYLMENNVAQDI